MHSRPDFEVTYIVYAISMFTGAFLLFWVQPMFGKELLPLLGGVPSVWNTCMVFYQTLLFAGYVYAHVSVRALGLKIQPVFHLLLLVAAAIVLPIGLPTGMSAPDVSRPITWLLTALSLSVGLPFFLLSATAPLLQHWHAYTKTENVERPYTLYAYSNLGSMLALVAYLVWIEPRMGRISQSWTWTVIYGLMVVFMAVCSMLLLRNRKDSRATGQFEASGREKPASIGNSQRLKWVILAFIPSSLLLGVTTHITTNIAPVPLMWVVPLILYLATFVIVFSGRRFLPYRYMASVQPFLALPLALAAYWLMDPAQVIGMKYAVAYHLVFFFVCSMVCHGLLVDSKPPTEQLTEFYVWLSLGGVLGGIFNALLAPVLFKSMVEYSLAIAAACFCRPSLSGKPGKRFAWPDAAMNVGVLAVVGLMSATLRMSHGAGMVIPVLHIGSAAVALGILLLRNRKLVFGTGTAALLLAGFFSQSSYNVLYTGRDFFGVHRVYRSIFDDSVTLQHGSIVHGVQYRDPASVRIPQHYYSPSEPFGLFYDALRQEQQVHRVGVIGLGAGTMAAYGRPGQEWTFFEIDPDIARIAEDTSLFTYLADSRAPTEVILGDGRLSMAREPNDTFDLITVDAFSSDSIPVHLVTLEALRLYLDKLKPDGFLAFHISNRYLDLTPVLARLAGQLELDYIDCRVNSRWLFMGKDLGRFDFLIDNGTCGRPAVPRSFPLWTDESSSILHILR